MHFRHANEQEVDDRVFLARWSQWFAGPESQGRLSSKDAVPLLNKK